jgi:hypothetical protein
MDRSLVQFVRGLYFEVQTVEGVRPLEIWNGVRERSDPYEVALLSKNLLKIVIPLVNEKCAGRAFVEHQERVKRTLAALIAWYGEDPEARLYQRFPYPPTGDADQKELYLAVRNAARTLLEGIDADVARAPVQDKIIRGHGMPWHSGGPGPEAFPDSLFDFQELRIVDNELPYIIFTEKEFRVIHGIVTVYLWMIDADAIFLDTLSANGVPPTLIDEYRQFARKVHGENPLTIKGRSVDSHGLVELIQEKLKYEDYLDVFENVHKWFEQTRARFAA